MEIHVLFDGNTVNDQFRLLAVYVVYFLFFSERNIITAHVCVHTYFKYVIAIDIKISIASYFVKCTMTHRYFHIIAFAIRINVSQCDISILT